MNLRDVLKFKDIGELYYLDNDNKRLLDIDKLHTYTFYSDRLAVGVSKIRTCDNFTSHLFHADESILTNMWCHCDREGNLYSYKDTIFGHSRVWNFKHDRALVQNMSGNYNYVFPDGITSFGTEIYPYGQAIEFIYPYAYVLRGRDVYYIDTNRNKVAKAIRGLPSVEQYGNHYIFTITEDYVQSDIGITICKKDLNDYLKINHYILEKLVKNARLHNN